MVESNRSIVVGTAGHIDHGKSALVRALTGTDPDRLKEEKARGITIDLGFAHAQIGDFNVAFVDVPGHERFVKNMLAGAGGIDVVLLVIAADECVMPQTREHFDDLPAAPDPGGGGGVDQGRPGRRRHAGAGDASRHASWFRGSSLASADRSCFGEEWCRTRRAARRVAADRHRGAGAARTGIRDFRSIGCSPCGDSARS